jgi:hypothetical protein
VVHDVKPPPCFKRGDADCDGCVDEDDATFINNFLFVAGSPAPCCDDAADADDNGVIDILDSTFILNYLNTGGAPPPPPGPGSLRRRSDAGLAPVRRLSQSPL